MKKYIILGIIVGVLLIGGSYLSDNFSGGGATVLSTTGVHWHPTLAIYIDGELVDIPDNVGLIGGHSPIHTHDRETDASEAGESMGDGRPLHVEIAGTVHERDVRLGNFFDTWGKPFSSECVLDTCIADAGGTITMLVNGEESSEYENYLMKDGDRIEIFYNSEGRTATSADNAPEGSIHNLPVPAAVDAVKDLVAQELGISKGLVIVMTAYEKEWSDSCLGLGGPAESCLFAITPGYEVTVQAKGEERVYRTNESGSSIRREK